MWGINKVDYEIEKLKERISNLPVDYLQRIIEVDFNDYEDYAIEIVREELSRRKGDFRLSDLHRTDFDISIKEHFGIFMDLLKDVEFESVESSIATMYPDQLIHIEKYMEVYVTLLQLEPSEGNVDYLNVENSNHDWNVTGEDASSGEKYGVEFYAWRDWLSFLLKDEQVYEIGKENYIAICLIILTQYGFDEEEIQREFRKMETVNGSKSENIDNSQPIYKLEKITLARTVERAIDIKQEIVEKRGEKQGHSQIRPWIRFWARTIDSIILGLFLGYAWLLAIPDLYSWDRSHTLGYGYSLINFLIWALIEAYFISKLGCTPGKWILNIRISDNNGNNLSFANAFKRVMLILVYGRGLLIPLVSFIASIIAYVGLRDKGITKWDEKMKVVVSHKDISIYRAVLAASIIIGIPIIMLVMNRTIMSSLIG